MLSRHNFTKLPTGHGINLGRLTVCIDKTWAVDSLH